MELNHTDITELPLLRAALLLTAQTEGFTIRSGVVVDDNLYGRMQDAEDELRDLSDDVRRRVATLEVNGDEERMYDLAPTTMQFLNSLIDGDLYTIFVTD